jgi:hypothetical protein
MFWIMSVSENRDDCMGIFFVVHSHNRELDTVSGNQENCLGLSSTKLGPKNP